MTDPDQVGSGSDDAVLHALFEAQKALQESRQMLLTIAIPALHAVAERCEQGATEARLKQATRMHEIEMGRIDAG